MEEWKKRKKWKSGKKGKIENNAKQNETLHTSTKILALKWKQET